MKKYIPLKGITRTVTVSVCFSDCKMRLNANTFYTGGVVFASSSGLLFSYVTSSIIATILQHNSRPFLLSYSFWLPVFLAGD